FRLDTQPNVDGGAARPPLAQARRIIAARDSAEQARRRGDSAPAAAGTVPADSGTRASSEPACARTGPAHIGRTLRRRGALPRSQGRGDRRWRGDLRRGRDHGGRFALDVLGRGPALLLLCLRLNLWLP